MSAGYLVDTNVLSEARRASANAGVRAWLASVKGEDLYLSVLVVGEVRRGIDLLRRRDPDQAAVYEDWLARLLGDYADRLLLIDVAVAEEWGRMSVPDPLPVVDGLIAATARTHDLTVVTRNTADFARAGVRTLNPFFG